MVAKYLGHSKIDETLNTYSHVFQSKLDDIVNTLNNLDKQYAIGVNFRWKLGGKSKLKPSKPKI